MAKSISPNDNSNDEKGLLLKIIDYLKCKNFGGEFLCLECLTPHSALDSINSDYTTIKLNYKRIKDGIKHGYSQSSNLTDDSSDHETESCCGADDYHYKKIPIILEDSEQNTDVSTEKESRKSAPLNGALGPTKNSLTDIVPVKTKLNYHNKSLPQEVNVSKDFDIKSNNNTESGSKLSIASAPVGSQINSSSVHGILKERVNTSFPLDPQHSYALKGNPCTNKSVFKTQSRSTSYDVSTPTGVYSQFAARSVLKQRMRDLHLVSPLSETNLTTYPKAHTLDYNESSSYNKVLTPNHKKLMLLKCRFNSRELMQNNSYTLYKDKPSLQPYQRLKENYNKAHSYDTSDCDIQKRKPSLCVSKSVDNEALSNNLVENKLYTETDRNLDGRNKEITMSNVELYLGDRKEVVNDSNIMRSNSYTNFDCAEQVCSPVNEAAHLDIGTLTFYVKYDFPNESLHIKIIELTNFLDKMLEQNDTKGLTQSLISEENKAKFENLKSDVYNVCLKFCLLPDQKTCYRTTMKKVNYGKGLSKSKSFNHFNENGKRENEIESLDLTFEETFIVRLPYSEALRRILDITLENADKEKQIVMGSLFLPINSIDIIKGDRISECIKLDLKKSSNYGEILIGLNFLPKAGRLIVDIIKATNLLQTGDLAGRDPFVKVSLLDNAQLIKQKRTTVKRRTLNPVYNESFNFRLRQDDTLDNISLVISVCDNRNKVKGKGLVSSSVVGFGSSQIIGRIVFGKYSTGPQQIHHWERMLSKNRRNGVAQWQPLLTKAECDAISPIVSLKC